MTDYNRENEFLRFLSDKGLNLPPFTPSETMLIWSRQDCWARHPETQRWWYLPADRPGREWVESLNTCSRMDLL
jgi:hypothetical protein